MFSNHDPYGQIPRISAPSKKIFETEYFLKRQPVIITDLFCDQPIQKIASLDTVRELFGQVPIQISEGFRAYHFYPDLLLDHKPLYNHHCLISDYLDLIVKNLNTLVLCNENEMPKEFQELFSYPEYCQIGGLPEDTVARLFIGNKGNYAHLHYDSDCRHVLFYQAIGSKRLVIIPPNAAPKLAPHHHWSLFCLEHFSEAERKAFLEYVGGVQCILQAGETLYFPAAAWHYVDYLTDGLSIAIRFGRNQYTQFLASKLHPSSLLQRLLAKMLTDEIVETHYKTVFELLKRAYNLPAHSVSDKQNQMENAYKESWSLVQNCREPIFQIAITPELEQSMYNLDSYQYRQFLKPSVLNGWSWLPSHETLNHTLKTNDQSYSSRE